MRMKKLTYEPPVGCHITQACLEAIELAKENNCHVAFRFNDVEMSVSPKSTTDQASQEWNEKFEKAAAKYRQSPEYAAMERDRESARLMNQGAMQMLERLLPNILKTNNLDAILSWIYSFTRTADNAAITFDAQGVHDQFIAAGYEKNEHVGQPHVWFNNRERMGRYIIGQALDALSSGRGPHPICLRFCDDYFDLPEEVAPQ